MTKEYRILNFLLENCKFDFLIFSFYIYILHIYKEMFIKYDIWYDVHMLCIYIFRWIYLNLMILKNHWNKRHTKINLLAK